MNQIMKFHHVDMSFYDLKKETEVLQDLSFSIEKENIYAIIGPSGCGKSTILNLIAGITTPIQGTIEKPNSIGYMFQRDNLFDWLTILDNVCIGLKIQKKKTEENIQYAKALLEKYGLKDFMDAYPRELSGGMRQRVALIRALVTKPEVLLLDEPFSALDAQTRLEVSSDIYQIIKDFKITTLIVTHDISEAISLADYIFVLTNRPAKMKSIYTIELSNLKPMERRTERTFKDYFNQIWGEINDQRL